jgi:hypothetical protein
MRIYDKVSRQPVADRVMFYPRGVRGNLIHPSNCSDIDISQTIFGDVRALLLDNPCSVVRELKTGFAAAGSSIRLTPPLVEVIHKRPWPIQQEVL